MRLNESAVLIPQCILRLSLWLIVLRAGRVRVDPNLWAAEPKGKCIKWAFVLLCLLSDEDTLCIRMLEISFNK